MNRGISKTKCSNLMKLTNLYLNHDDSIVYIGWYIQSENLI